MATIGERVKQLRIEKGLTQAQLAAMIDVARATLASWEVDRRVPDADALRELAQTLDTTTDYLLGRTDDRNSPKKKKYSNAQIAAWRLDGYGELPPDVQKQLEDYLDYVFTKYGKKDPDKENGPDKTK